MAFKIEITHRDDPAGATAYAVVVTIDDHETVVSFESKEVAERFAETERANSRRRTTGEKRPTDLSVLGKRGARQERRARLKPRSRSRSNGRIPLTAGSRGRIPPRLRLELRVWLAAWIKR